MKEGYVARTEITIAKRASQTPSQFGSNFRTYPGTAAHAREQTESGMTAPTAPTAVGRRAVLAAPPAAEPDTRNSQLSAATPE
jgi:hypothetical protein